jgi:vitamin B12 transporter
MTWVNLGGATVTGIEAALSCSLHPFGSEWALDPYVNGTYLTEYSDDATGDKLNYTPEWNANIGIRIKDQHGFSSVFNLACTGETMVQNWEDWSGDVVAKGGFSVANLTVSKKFPIDGEKKNGRSLTITGEINNLFDREYQYVKGYPMPGRTFTVGLSADI